MQKGIKHAPSELAGGATCYIERKTVQAGTRFAPHWHDYFELELVLAGEGEHCYNRQAQPLSRGSAYLMAYYDFHELYAKTDLALLKIQCTEQALPPDLRDHILLGGGRFCATLTDKELRLITTLFAQIEQERKDHAAFEKTVTQNAITTIFVTLLRHSTKNTPAPLPPLLQQLVRTAQTRFRENITLHQLATDAFVTPNYLGALFKKWTGSSFSEYLNTVRLRHACELLATTELSVKEIAFSSGYRSVEHFCFTFQKTLLCTPKSFRQKQREEKID